MKGIQELLRQGDQAGGEALGRRHILGLNETWLTDRPLPRTDERNTTASLVQRALDRFRSEHSALAKPSVGLQQLQRVSALADPSIRVSRSCSSSWGQS